MLELKNRESAETSPQLKALVAKQICGVDNAIDAAVYELYGLSDKEIKIVESI